MFTPQQRKGFSGWSISSRDVQRAGAGLGSTNPRNVKGKGIANALESGLHPSPVASLEENGGARLDADGDLEAWQCSRDAGLLDEAALGRPDREALMEGISQLDQEVTSKVSSRIAQIRLVSRHSEVYEPCDDSFALVDALLADRANLLEHQPRLCLEVGSGSGYVITSLAIMLGEESSRVHYFATDINPHAVVVTRETLQAHGVHAEVICTDIASGLEKRLAGMVDVVVVNPPYVPTPEEEVGCDGITAAWAGGEDGRTVIDRILPVVDELLSEKGWLYMVTLTANNPSQICLLMREKGFASRIIVQRSTEEENLHVIKFWRDADMVVNESKLNRTVSGSMESWLSQFTRLSFWKSDSSETKWN